MSLMYKDHAFKNSWVERKRGITPASVDETARYVSPPSLKKVQWKFWDFDLSKGPSEYSQEEVSFDDDFVTDFSDIGSDGEGE